ncbi:hypothetical protein BSR28_01025 [Boudabousia liubingyangii]|uniref:CPBP family intramembrane glutamic endopeptidase n=1 Tax=Boudabousia liubingyangii TaxID=1921764 RepID=UPI00093AEC80|nr:CPBP family intramembrane glutamic endopeptidase [Boudabousia liubingyangii]OKL48319.1 hypothetical protein BSR28_01025 [Boudabousia liubingyangii]
MNAPKLPKPNSAGTQYGTQYGSTPGHHLGATAPTSWFPPLAWTLGYIALMALSLVTAQLVFNTNFNDPNFLFNFLPLMTILALYAAIALKMVGFKTPVVADLNAPTQAGSAALIWVAPWIALEVLFLGYVAAQATADSALAAPMVIAFAFTALVGFAEEAIFRGVLLSGTARALGVIPAMLLSAVLFSLLHAVNFLGGMATGAIFTQLWRTLLFGLAFAPIVILCRRLWPVILVHWWWDFLVVVMPSVPGGDSYLHLLQQADLALQIVMGTVAWIVVVSRFQR